LLPDETGVYKSATFLGLWLDAPALLRGDLATLLKVLGEGMASREHEEFAQQMRQKVATLSSP
jgi:TfoX/Sxy family transcriptional regulator of competence genes